MMSGAIRLLVIFVVVLAGSQAAYGCVCLFEPRKLTESENKAAIAREFNESAIVFSGEVISQDTFFVKFRLIKMWKGIGPDEFLISTGATKIDETSHSSSSCDYSFAVGKEYLVYARWAEGNQVVARVCTRTRELSTAEKDTEELDVLNPSAYQAPQSPAALKHVSLLGERYSKTIESSFGRRGRGGGRGCSIS